VLYTVGIVLIFLFTSAVFIHYHIFVTRRQAKVEESAARSNAIVTSLFPAQVRDRLLVEQEGQAKNNKNGRRGSLDIVTNSKYGEPGRNIVVLDNNDDEEAVTDKLLRTKPIADLFPNATVMFADICGFTAWSSVREPTQVFTLLEQIYNSFDVLARKRRIFKVETIGDCYVAAAGLPDPRPDHAVAMARFANECLVKMHTVVKKLEVRLGPDTAELGMRFGLHSGPVTAGVLRGEKSRFQLFGDTVNTASRIETTGERNRIHISEDTAKLLINSGKIAWVEQREGLVAAKGKGEIVTYWLSLTPSKHRRGTGTHVTSSNIHTDAGGSENMSMCSESTLFSDRRRIALDQMTVIDDRKQRLINWNVDVLANFLKKIRAMRVEDKSNLDRNSSILNDPWSHAPTNTTVLDEVREIILLPQEEMIYQTDPQMLELDAKIISQLKDYVGLIASMYRDNSFHNFEHASHVTQSVTKLLSRIVTADDIDYNDLQYKKKGNVSLLHKHTYGITSDPITQFACAFSALIHDVDHTGVPNNQLVKEETDVALFYKNKSVAEQNSVDLAWSLLMEKEFEGLRSLIYRSNAELDRFRQLVVNGVMATDIADKELGTARKARWNKAFHIVDENSEGKPEEENPMDAVNRKATIVIEHLIQASDVSHTMQHWHVYVKWNEKLFHEMYKAFQENRAEKDPSENWYKGELGFFDFYIIPLAKKLKNCGVFGVASDEYLNYAEANREEWERKGQDMVKKYLYSYQKAS
jgi:class 3 adenylate cyclase